MSLGFKFFQFTLFPLFPDVLLQNLIHLCSCIVPLTELTLPLRCNQILNPFLEPHSCSVTSSYCWDNFDPLYWEHSSWNAASCQKHFGLFQAALLKIWMKRAGEELLNSKNLIVYGAKLIEYILKGLKLKFYLCDSMFLSIIVF